MSENENTEKQTEKKNDMVLVEEVLSLAESCGCLRTEQSAYFKLTAPTDNKRAIYVSKTKSVMTRLDVSGWEPSPHEAIKQITAENAKDLKLGAVRGQILSKELRCDKLTVLQAVEQLVDELLSGDSGFKMSPRQPKEKAEELATTEPSVELLTADASTPEVELAADEPSEE